MNILEKLFDFLPIIFGYALLLIIIISIGYRFYIDRKYKLFEREIRNEINKEQPDFRKIISNIVDFQVSKQTPYAQEIVDKLKDCAFWRLHRMLSGELNKEQPNLQKIKFLLNDLGSLTYDEVSKMNYNDLNSEFLEMYQENKMEGIEKKLTGKLGHSDFMLSKVANKGNWYQLEAKDGNYLALFSIEGVPPNIELVKFFKTNKEVKGEIL